MATIVDVFLLLCLVELGGVAPALANVPALLGGLAVQFVGNKYWAFDDQSESLLRQGAAFAVIEVGAVALNAAGFHLLIAATTVPYPLARLLTSALVYGLFSYPLWHLVFRPGARAGRI